MIIIVLWSSNEWEAASSSLVGAKFRGGVAAALRPQAIQTNFLHQICSFQRTLSCALVLVLVLALVPPKPKRELAKLIAGPPKEH